MGHLFMGHNLLEILNATVNSQCALSYLCILCKFGIGIYMYVFFVYLMFSFSQIILTVNL